MWVVRYKREAEWSNVGSVVGCYEELIKNSSTSDCQHGATDRLCGIPSIMLQVKVSEEQLREVVEQRLSLAVELSKERLKEAVQLHLKWDKIYG